MPPYVDPEADPVAAAIQVLAEEAATAAERDGRAIRLITPVKGDPGFLVLRALGLAQAATPIGAAAHGQAGVAAGVWRQPDLYLARWSTGGRRVVGYRLTGTSKPDDYVRIEGRIPTRLETGNWYGDVPEVVAEAFFEVGFLLDEPPFDPPPTAPPRPSPPVKSSPRAKRARGGDDRARPRSPSAPSQPKPAVPKRPSAPTTQLCPECRMHKALRQFTDGSELCVDCR